MIVIWGEEERFLFSTMAEAAEAWAKRHQEGKESPNRIFFVQEDGRINTGVGSQFQDFMAEVAPRLWD